jgi:hypothetical protein
MSKHKIDYRPQGERGEHGHEPTDDNIRNIVVSGAVLVVICIGVLLFLSWLMRGFKAQERAGDTVRPPLFADDRGQFPEPRLQENPHADLLKMREVDRIELSSYGWVDENEKKIAKIPIERAMDIIAKRGLPQPGSHPEVEEESDKGATPPKSAEKPGKPGVETKSPASGLKKSESEIPAADDAKSKGKPGGGGG